MYTVDEFKQLPNTPVQDFMGYVYILDWGDKIKIGYTNCPKSRIAQHIRNAQTYGADVLSRIAISPPCTNYTKVEAAMHTAFNDMSLGHEYFSVPFELAVKQLSTKEYIDDSAQLDQRANSFCEAMKNFLLSGKFQNSSNVGVQSSTLSTIEQNPSVKSVVAHDDSAQVGVISTQASTDFQVFNHTDLGQIRVVFVNGEPYFVGKDLCNVFNDTNHNRSLSRVAVEDKIYVPIIDSLGREQNAIAVNESGMYALLFSMQPQRANNGGVSDAYPIEIQLRIDRLNKFKHWVTSEVLPAIRKHGAYMTEDIIQKALASPDFLIQIATQLKESQEKAKQLQIEVEQQSQHIAQQNVAIYYMKPKADYCDRVLACKEAVSITVIAKDYGWSAIEMNRFLQDHRVQFRRGNQWFLYQKYAKFGYTVTRTKVITDRMGTEHTEIWTYWTQKGRLFIYEFLKERGILPIYERPILPLPNVPHYQPPCKKEVDE